MTLPTLNDGQLRILGALIEKEATTPDAYPLSLNALTHACNQSTNRDPVVAYTVSDVERELDSLRRTSLVHRVERGESRVVRYRHVVNEVLALDPPALAVVAVLLLRGHQTSGEIRSRCQRLHDFQDLHDVDATLSALRTREPDAIVEDLPRRPGQKETRYTHRLGSGADTPMSAEPEVPTGDRDRIDRLEAVTAQLEQDVSQLRDQLEQFRKQFE
jgi:uncharacterized protein YceH (UPF0502 family)